MLPYIILLFIVRCRMHLQLLC